MAERLAARMYAEWRSKSPDPTAHPAWGNLPTEERIPWEAAEVVARAAVTEECASKLEAELPGVAQSYEREGVGFAINFLRGERD